MISSSLFCCSKLASDFGTAYDHPVTASAALPSTSALHPPIHRTLTGWYLTRRTFPDRYATDSGDDDDDDDDDDGGGGDGGGGGGGGRGRGGRSHPSAAGGLGGPTPLAAWRRCPLPLDRMGLRGYVLRGRCVRPRPLPASDADADADADTDADTDAGPMVVLPTLASWSYDRTSEGRGIWITSAPHVGEGNGALYRLAEPCGRGVPLAVAVAVAKTGAHVGADGAEGEGEGADGNADADADRGGGGGGGAGALLPSQEELHLPLRARAGLLSNLADLLTEPCGGARDADGGDGGDGDGDGPGGTAPTYVSIHAKRTPDEVHALLTPTEEQLVLHNRPAEGRSLNASPFDLDLLRTCPGFVRHHLEALDEALDGECAFFQALDRMEAARREGGDGSAGSGTWPAEALRRSAEEAEARGRRRPWGEFLPGTLGSSVRPNRLIDIQIQEASDLVERARLQLLAEGDGRGDEEEKGGEQGEGEKGGGGAAPAPTGGGQEEEEEEEEEKGGTGAAPAPTGAPPAPPFDVLAYFDIRPGGGHSPAAMAEAVATMARYLHPAPSASAKSEKAYQGGMVPAGFSVPDEAAPSFVANVVQRETMPSLEYVLLAIGAIRSGGKRVMKGLFKATHDSGRVVFEKWLDAAVWLLDSSPGRQDGGEGGCEARVVASLMGLICDFHVIKGAKQLALLKSKFGVDWDAAIEKARAFSERHCLSGVAEESRKARDHVDSIREGTVTVASKIILPPTPPSPPPPEPTAPSSFAEDKQQKEEKERMRRKRMQKMLKMAQTRAVTYGGDEKRAEPPPAAASASEPAVPSRSLPLPPKRGGGGWGEERGMDGPVKGAAGGRWGSSRAEPASQGGGWGGTGHPDSTGGGGGWGADRPDSRGWSSQDPREASAGRNPRPQPQPRPQDADPPNRAQQYQQPQEQARSDSGGRGSRDPRVQAGGWDSQQTARSDPRATSSDPRAAGGWGGDSGGASQGGWGEGGGGGPGGKKRGQDGGPAQGIGGGG